MAQHDMNIANQGFPATRADLNNALQALATNSSGTSAPSTTFANQWWYDTTNNKLYIRNEANNAWIQVAVLDQTNNEWQITTGQISASDGDGLVFKTDDGNTRITLSDGGDVTFADGTDVITASAGTDNVRIGAGAGDSITSGGNDNVVIGTSAGTAITTGDANSIVGHAAGDAITTGGRHTLMGYASGSSLIDPDRNVAFGYGSLQTDTKGTKSTAIGYSALNTQNFSSATDSHNTAVGYTAGESVTTGTENTFVGSLSGDAVTTGLGNTLVGYNSGTAVTTANNNTAVGREALFSATNGHSNTAVGREALKRVTSGTYNTACGFESGKELTTGTFNVAMGYFALQTCTAGDDNVAIGAYALHVNVGEHNVAVGREALPNNTSGDYNTALGYKAGVDITSSSDYNTCVGGFSGNNLTSGGIENVFLGYNTITDSGSSDNQIVIGVDVDSIGSNYVTIGKNTIGRIYNQYSANATWTRTSDERIKKDIQTNTDCGLAFINDLRTVTYKWKAPSEHPEEFLSYNADVTEASYTEKMYGFIAQEVKQAMDDHNITGFNGWHVKDGNGDQQGVSYEMFVMPLVKAVQELSAKVDALETRIAALEA